jgi:uncharacterized protein (TIGR02646 family)
MKYIKKKTEPNTLKEKRGTVGSRYECAQEDWQKQLLDEQGYLCAYCMKPISLDRDKNGKPRIEIEHYLSRKQHPNLGLQWKNMLGVCNGISGINPHCDKAKGKENDQGFFIKGKIDGDSKLRFLNPLDRGSSEKVIKYSLTGEILPNTTNQGLDQKIREDLNCILNLNDDKLKRNRKGAMDDAKDLLKRKYPTGKWEITDIDKEIRDWQSRTKDGRYKAYCQAAIWYLEQLKK